MCCPVTIRSVSGIDVLPSARSVYYIFKGAALINVVAGIAENRAWPDWKDASPVTNMRTFTLEALINGNAFKNQISTIMVSRASSSSVSAIRAWIPTRYRWLRRGT